MIRALLPAVVIACGTPSTPAVATGAQPVAFVDDAIVVEVSGLASSGNAPIRTLRRIVAARHGQVEVTRGFGEVTLVVTKVVSGTLFDPDYAQRPIGANHLEVVFVDEAAYVAPLLHGTFKGTWHLTQLADGMLVASAIEGTPWKPALVAGRRQVIANRRDDLRAQSVERRMAGLHALQDHQSYELVPDVIALLDDNRRSPHDRRSVGDAADATLSGLAMALGADFVPEGRSIEVWTKYWAERFTRVDPLPAIAPSTATEHMRLFSNQSWPEVAMVDGGVVVGVTRLEHALDGNAAGIFVNAGATRTWLTREPFEHLQVAGTGMVWSDPASRWHFTTMTGKSAVMPPGIARAAWAAIAPADDGFLVLGVKSAFVQAVQLDANGKRRRTARFELPASAADNVLVAARPGGWLAVVTTSAGIFTVSIDGGLRVRATTNISARGVPATLTVGRDRVFVAWNVGNEIESRVIDLDGKPITEPVQTGDEVWDLSTPVALDDGFAIAWIEAGRELHVGRFDRNGARVSNVVVQDRHIAPRTLHLAHDGAALLVTYVDVTRYPYAVVTRRL